MTSHDHRAPEHVGVIGAGMVGLATAWFLQEQGVKVTVFERDHVAAGSSWGNAGWLTPGLTVPLPDPSVLKYGIKAVLSPASPVYVPFRADPRLARFLLGFVRNSTTRQWRLGMSAFVAANNQALDAFDRLTAGGVEAPTRDARPFLACFRTREDMAHLLDELEHIRSVGQDLTFDVLTGAEAQDEEKALSPEVGAAVRLHNQRFINPGEFVNALADSVRARGGHIQEDVAVTDIRDTGSATLIQTATGAQLVDAVVVATGTWLNAITRKFGVRQVVQAGRGYSFSVPVDHLPAGPIYLPTQRVACTPLGDRLRVAGMMEFRSPEAPLDQRRISAIIEATRPMLRGVDWEQRQDEWVGSRPCTIDGLPLIGPTTSPRVFVAGGHSMWGIALGPLTGQLLAQLITTGQSPAELVPFHPLR